MMEDIERIHRYLDSMENEMKQMMMSYYRAASYDAKIQKLLKKNGLTADERKLCFEQQDELRHKLYGSVHYLGHMIDLTAERQWGDQHVSEQR